VAAGLIGAILSSVDSMMNSAATLITFDGYKRFVNPKASEEQLVKLGRIVIGVIVIGSAGLTILIFDPNSKEPFMQYVIGHQSKLVAGIVAAFLLGMLWKGATAAGAFTAIITGIVVSYGLPVLFASFVKGEGDMAREMLGRLGPELNVFHSVFVAFVFALLANMIVSKLTEGDEGKSKFTWIGLNLIKPVDLQHFGMKLIGSLLIYGGLGVLMSAQILAPVSAGILAAVWTFMMFLDSLFKVVLAAAVKGRAYSLLREDRFWAGLLASCAIFMMYYFK
jgi:SSS family solute:Na+ symporter